MTVYFTTDMRTGLIKIGHTNWWGQRVKTLPYYDTSAKLCVSGFINGAPKQLEKQLHKIFSPINVRGVLRGNEWFAPADGLIQYIIYHTTMTSEDGFDYSDIKRTDPYYPLSSIMSEVGYDELSCQQVSHNR